MGYGTPYGELKALSFDFDVRSLVPLESFSAELGQESKVSLDAIYVPTRSRPAKLLQLLRQLDDPGAPIYLIPTSESDLPASLPQRSPASALLLRNGAWLSKIHALASFSAPKFSIAPALWDLPLKRNYAILHARQSQNRRILLLDDDIRLSHQQLAVGAAALERYDMAGYFVDDFPDTSMIGHLERSIGQPVLPFLSGSCLFVRTDASVGPFPAIYNEDWICMAPAIARGSVVALGLTEQNPYEPFEDPNRAALQEPGEIIADGLFALIAAGAYHQRLDPAAWQQMLDLRRSWLLELSGLVTEPHHLATVQNALNTAGAFAAIDCVSFVGAWERDFVRWDHNCGARSS